MTPRAAKERRALPVLIVHEKVTGGTVSHEVGYPCKRCIKEAFAHPPKAAKRGKKP